MKKLLKRNYENRWYKVWYTDEFYTGEKYHTFVYGFGDEQVKRQIRDYNAYKVTEWLI